MNKNMEADNCNFKLCVLCQLERNEKLIHACDGKGVNAGVGAETLSKNLSQFHELDALPFLLKEPLKSNIKDLKNTLIHNNAVWHKSCYLKCSTLKLERARSRAANLHPAESVALPLTRSSESTRYTLDTCLFCESPGTKHNPLRAVMQQSCNDAILQYANTIKDYKLLAIISERSDLMALEAKYHLNCYTAYRHKAVNFDNTSTSSTVQDKQQAESLVFARVMSYIDDKRIENNNAMFTLPELSDVYNQFMKESGYDHCVNRQLLKNQILRECPHLISTSKPGVPILFTFKDNIDKALRTQVKRNFEEESNILCKAAKTVRMDILDRSDSENYKKAAPSLIALISMIINGPHLQLEHDRNDISLNLAELITYHTVCSRNPGSDRRHNKTQETSVAVFLAAKLYAATRKKLLINCTFKLGMSISYARLQSILTEKANAVCAIYHEENVVCPPKLQKQLFTTASVDNIDHNPSSTTAETAFHGTAITLMQHKTLGETGIARDWNLLTLNTNKGNRKVMELPSDYAVVPPCFTDVKKSICNQTDIYTRDVRDVTPYFGEREWLETTASESFKPWAAYHASVEENCLHTTEIALLSVFREHSNTAAMMLHTLDIVEKAINHLNPEQNPVLVADQPLYAILKQLQFIYPEKCNTFVMMGGLHIEMAVLKVLGQWLNGSGWVEALVQANVTTPGRSEALLSASHVSRTRYAHQVTASVLYTLQKDAYESQTQVDSNEPGNCSQLLSFEEWKLKNLSRIPQFKYWDMVLQLELCLLQFIRSIRTGNFNVYKDSLRHIIPWFFSLDHINYARWLSVHIRDLENLKNSHPSLHLQFEAGKFVANKTNRSFSGMALDQAHEQVNAFMKGDGGMIGITEDPDKLRKWLIGGPELASLVEEFENEKLQLDSEDNFTSFKGHHSESVTNTDNFAAAAASLKDTINQLGNPFMEITDDLYNIENKRITSADFVNTVKHVEQWGEEQYLAFCKERLKEGKKLYDPIKLNKYPLFSHDSKKKSDTKTKSKIAALKNDCSLFSKLYIATCEHRAGDLDKFFAHENQSNPPALSVLDNLRSCIKSDLLKCLTGIPSQNIMNQACAPDVSAKVLDGPAIIHMLNPGQSRTFAEYADNVVVPFIRKEMTNVSRLDLVWDRYDKNSLKRATRDKRGSGLRTRVELNTKIPKEWANFLRDDLNKEELFDVLSIQCHKLDLPVGKEIYITKKTMVISNVPRELPNMMPCNHEEADTRMMVHVADSVEQGHSKIMIRTVDTDVVVIAVSCVQKLPQLQELWVHIGTGKNHNFIACHSIASALGPDKAAVLPVFHAFTGCDTVSSFNGRGKKSAFEAWNAFNPATQGFKLLQDGAISANSIIQKYVMILYDRSSPCLTINECRKYLFTKKDRQLENIPPTEAALYQHLLRAVYQGVHVYC